MRRDRLRLYSVIVLACFIGACGGVKRVPSKPPEPTAMDPLPEDPGKEPLPLDKNWVVGISEPDDLQGREGILMADEKAARFAEYQISYKELRANYKLDRRLWQGTETIYLKYLWQADKRIEDLQPGWWDQNKGTLGFAAGFLVAALLAVGLVYGIDQADQPAQ